MVLWELQTNKIPYEGLSQTQILGQVGYGKEQVEIPDEGSMVILKLIKLCLNMEP